MERYLGTHEIEWDSLVIVADIYLFGRDGTKSDKQMYFKIKTKMITPFEQRIKKIKLHKPTMKSLFVLYYQKTLDDLNKQVSSKPNTLCYTKTFV